MRPQSSPFDPPDASLDRPEEAFAAERKKVLDRWAAMAMILFLLFTLGRMVWMVTAAQTLIARGVFFTAASKVIGEAFICFGAVVTATSTRWFRLKGKVSWLWSVFLHGLIWNVFYTLGTCLWERMLARRLHRSFRFPWPSGAGFSLRWLLFGLLALGVLAVMEARLRRLERRFGQR